ncbi:HORMAD1 [Cordylochernes scorpioides]|uniref:HORMAD1 n=1 Tax=Cordylochernes scorpioides TaxID=51811 RepID=A0ABY6LHH6_9ARAC|nr:HORMAD1 [Cordylochernes scorpioides]
MLEMTRTDPEWKDKIITGDETWVYGYDPETKRQSAEWRGQDVQVKLLDKDSEIPEVNYLLQVLENCFKAIEMKYRIIESYTFTFGYDFNETSLTCGQKNSAGGKEIHHSTKELINALPVVTSSLEPVPDHAHMTIRLYYYDEVTPVDYEPEGFEKCTYLQSTFVKEPPVKIDLGKMKTPYHNLKVKITSAQEYTQPNFKQYRKKYKDKIMVQFYQLSPSET